MLVGAGVAAKTVIHELKWPKSGYVAGSIIYEWMNDSLRTG
jgi:hypothetical protein